MKIAVLGSTGMLGSAVGKYLIGKFGEDNVHTSYRQRNKDKAYGKNPFYFDAASETFSDIISLPPECDYVINCIGVIKPVVDKLGTEYAILINSLFPQVLASACDDYGTKLIHITTDCVYSGKTGNYCENDLHDALDVYGKTKSLGEPDNCMVLRTSIIGEELHTGSSLVEWVKSQVGEQVSGYVNHFWNGITTKQYAAVCEKIIREDLYAEGTYHIFSPNDITKCELLQHISTRFKLNVDVHPVEASVRINRCLRTVKDLNSKLKIPCVTWQIEEM